MKKILAGTAAAVALLGTVSVASAQTLPLFPRIQSEPASVAQDYQRHYWQYNTSPYAGTGNSIGYNLNIAEGNNVGG